MCLKVVANSEAGGRNLVVVLQHGRHIGAEFKSDGCAKEQLGVLGRQVLSWKGFQKCVGSSPDWRSIGGIAV
jgi:hypothetical protein